ncbi:hypothetical protein EJ110_NYTH46996 [Nymphaea thermarum]|nr:hypothetical protein EJ110_NYTH46996 [Nymphaea thermarum]
MVCSNHYGDCWSGCIVYVNGRKVESVETNVAWDAWFLEDNEVKTWIVDSVFPDIQPLILHKRTARDMWVILEQMYGQNKKDVRVYQLMKDVYSLRQGLNDDFEGIRSQILNSEGLLSIEDVHSRVEVEEQRHLVITGKKGGHISYNERSALVSRGPVGALTSSQVHSLQEDGGGKASFSVEQICELRAYLSQIDVGPPEVSDDVKVNHALAVLVKKNS